MASLTLGWVWFLTFCDNHPPPADAYRQSVAKVELDRDHGSFSTGKSHVDPWAPWGIAFS